MAPLSNLHNAFTAVANANLKAADVSAAARTVERTAPAVSPTDVNHIAPAVLRGSANRMTGDLQLYVNQLTHSDQSKQDLKTSTDTVKGKLDSMSEMGEMESLRLQMAMDRLSKMMQTLSNVLKKLSNTASGIVSNLK